MITFSLYIFSCTALIKTACNELKLNFIVSKEFAEAGRLKGWQIESLGRIDLKGKDHVIELFSLKILNYFIGWMC